MNLLLRLPRFTPLSVRRLWGVPAAALLAVLAAPATGYTQEAAPNVVMIISDDQGWNDYGFMGHPHIETPRLDRLAAESLTFTRGYVPSSLCRPSLATIITGLYARDHGLVGNDPPRPPAAAAARGADRQRHPDYLPVREAFIAHIDRVTTLPERLGEIGYASLQTGKWWEGHFSRGGFTAGMTEGDLTRDGRHGDRGLTIGRQGLEPIERFVDAATGQQQPFFVWYAPFLPHTPHNPPERLLAKYRERTDSLPIAKYWAMCEWFDETCGALLDLLDQRGLAENTLVLYVCDNGWINRPDATDFDPRSKRSPNEGGVRTPIMVRWPGKVTPRREETQLASSLDLVPTTLAACGLPIPAELPGIDLLDAESVDERQAIFGEIYEHDVRAMDDPVASLRYRWMIQGRWKLIAPDPVNEPEESAQLYDVVDDPHEEHDLAADQPQRLDELQRRLDQWWQPRE